MSKPVLESIDRASETWLADLNSNFEKLVDAPFPVFSSASVVALTASHKPALYSGCWAIVNNLLHVSDGTTWLPFRGQLNYVADLDPGTVSLSDILTAYNNLLLDMQSKGWMSSS